MTKTKKPPQKGLKLEKYISQALYANSIELFIYDTKVNMIAGMRKWLIANKYNKTAEEQFSLVGCVFENNRNQTYRDKHGEEYKLFAALFLCEEFLSMDLLAHECLHVAMTLERNIIRYCGLYDGNDGSGNAAEERLAYCVGDFMDQILRACIKEKVKLKFVMEDKKCECCNEKEKK